MIFATEDTEVLGQADSIQPHPYSLSKGEGFLFSKSCTITGKHIDIGKKSGKKICFTFIFDI
jgi:hypothetical protein